MTSEAATASSDPRLKRLIGIIFNHILINLKNLLLSVVNDWDAVFKKIPISHGKSADYCLRYDRAATEVGFR
jgi:hypothetical protein